MYDVNALFLSIVGVLFTITVLGNFGQTWRLLKPRSSSAFSLSLSGEKTRSCFLLLLFGACVSRLITIIIFLRWSEHLTSWSYDLLIILPALIFLTSFSIIALFWAQVYYTSRFMVLSHSQFLFWFLNTGIYTIVFIVAGMARLLGALDELRIYNSIVLGILCLAVGFSFGLYGLKVAFQFSGNLDTRAYDSRRSAVIRRVLLLATLAPIAFWIRAAYEAAIGAHFIDTQAGWKGLNIRFWDTAMMVISEWFPAQLVLTLFSPPKRINVTTVEEPADLNSYRSHLLDAESRFPQDRSKDVLLSFVPQSMYSLGGKANELN